MRFIIVLEIILFLAAGIILTGFENGIIHNRYQRMREWRGFFLSEGEVVFYLNSNSFGCLAAAPLFTQSI